MKLPPDLERRVLELAGEPPASARKRRPPAVMTDAATRWSVTLTLPCRVISEANRRDHWTVANRRKDDQRRAVSVALCDIGFRQPAGMVGLVRQWVPPLPCVVTLTHVGPTMDDDNLRRAFKAIRDAIASGWLGVDDGDQRVKWEYDQRTGTPGVEVRIEGGGQ